LIKPASFPVEMSANVVNELISLATFLWKCHSFWWANHYVYMQIYAGCKAKG